MTELLISSNGFFIFSHWSSTLSLLEGNTSSLLANIYEVVSNPEISETGPKFSIDANRSLSLQNLDRSIAVSLFSTEFLVVGFENTAKGALAETRKRPCNTGPSGNWYKVLMSLLRETPIPSCCWSGNSLTHSYRPYLDIYFFFFLNP